MTPLRLSAATILDPNEAFMLTRAELTSHRPKALHDQDFHELLWVQNGHVRLHLPSGKEILSEGDLLFISPGQPHGLQGQGPAPLVVSLSIRASVIDSLGQRHNDLNGLAFWADTPSPLRMRRDVRALADLNRAALRLERADRSQLQLEAFLLPVLTTLDRPKDTLSPNAPDWLRRACAAAEDPAVFRDGAAGFVAQTGRAHPHVSRSLKRFLGQTPSEFINAKRMAFAARKLTGTADTLAEIAEDCGIPNLSHFHKLFSAAYGETPQRYRRARQQNVIQPRP
ncbi:MAG: AraC family transcriptional regulator [Pseudomonadota bacterium]